MTNKQIFNQDISNINSYLFMLFGFTLALSVSIPSIIFAVMLLLWLYEGNFSKKLETIKKNPITYAFLAYFLIHIIALLWTSDFAWGLHIIKKQWKILAFLFFITIVKQRHIKHYIIAFLLSMSLLEILSYGIWFKIIKPFQVGTVDNPIPFTGHISYNPLLAFAAYLLAYFLLFTDNKSLFQRAISLIFLTTITVNMFITGGRSGQVGYFVMVAILTIQYFKKDVFKIFLTLAVLMPTIFFMAYSYSPLFNQRVNLAIQDAKHYKENPNTSVGLRLTFLFNSLDIIKENPIIGVGTGDFPKEYEKMNAKNTPKAWPITQPHNMYILVLVQTGIIGLITLLTIFYMQIKSSFIKTKYFQIKFALPLFFLVIMLGESYLLIHQTTLLFTYFSSFLYKDYESECT